MYREGGGGVILPLPTPLDHTLRVSCNVLVGQSPTLRKNGGLGVTRIPEFVPLQKFCSPIRLQHLNVCLLWTLKCCNLIGLHTPYISFFDIRVLWKKIPVGGLYTLIVLCDHPSLVSVLFAVLLSLHLVTF